MFTFNLSQRLVTNFLIEKTVAKIEYVNPNYCAKFRRIDWNFYLQEVENENFVLRDKLSKVRDELSVATKEMTSMTDILETKKANLKENAGEL